MIKKTVWPLWASTLLALTVAVGALNGLASQDVLHIYVRSQVTEFYRVYLDTGAGLPAQETMANTFFPADLADGAPRVNFPLPAITQQLRVVMGETPNHLMSGIRICVERSLLASHCVAGASLASYVEGTTDAKVQLDGGELNVLSLGGRPSLVFKRQLLDDLRPVGDRRVILARAAFFAATAALLFCFILAVLQPLAAWWTRDALWLFLAAGATRGLFFLWFQPGGVSDSDLFLRYLQFHIFGIPGIRGIVYPAFTTLFGNNLPYLFAAQFLLGAVGSAMVLLLIRSLTPGSRWDSVWAFVATSVPTLLAMEALVLSESFSLFLMLATVLSFRWLQVNPRSIVTVAGVGAACALLSNTKPQFAFIAVLFALVLAIPHSFRWRRLAAFAAPLLALQLFATALTFSRGNFRGTSSTLGYSLFDHGQQSIKCPTTDSDPHVQYYCEARAALPPDAAPYAYTAWMMFPAMHRLGEPFYRVTDDYARLSFKLISQHPALYARTAWESFLTFWTAEIPMAEGLLSTPKFAALRPIMKAAIPAERWARDAITAAFFLAIVGAAARRIKPDRDGFLFCALLICIVLVSSVLQALVESGRENPRFEIPTEPLLTITILYVFTRLRKDRLFGL